MPIHEEVLRAARRLCRERGGWTFTAGEVVRALPHLNERSVRTHIVSRCCVNAPKNHPHKWDYFRRVGRGRYEILVAYRKETRRERLPRSVAEPEPRYGVRSRPTARDAIHAVLYQDEDIYVAECLEVAVVTQGRTVDEVMSNLREAIALHLEGEDVEALGLSKRARILVAYEIPIAL